MLEKVQSMLIDSVFKSLCIDLFKTLKRTNPAFVKEIFELRKTNRAVRNQYKLNLEVPIINQVIFGAKRIRYLGPKIWNSIPFHIKSNESLPTFKRIIKNCDVVSCQCSIFQRWSTAVKINNIIY